jgi:hypothetical protein
MGGLKGKMTQDKIRDGQLGIPKMEGWKGRMA